MENTPMAESQNTPPRKGLLDGPLTAAELNELDDLHTSNDVRLFGVLQRSAFGYEIPRSSGSSMSIQPAPAPRDASEALDELRGSIAAIRAALADGRDISSLLVTVVQRALHAASIASVSSKHRRELSGFAPLATGMLNLANQAARLTEARNIALRVPRQSAALQAFGDQALVNGVHHILIRVRQVAQMFGALVLGELDPEEQQRLAREEADLRLATAQTENAARRAAPQFAYLLDR